MQPVSPPSFGRRVLADAADALIVNPPPSLVRAVVDILSEPHDGAVGDEAPPERVRLLCAPTSAETAFSDFLTTIDAADAVADGRLAVRTDPELDAGITLAGGSVHAHVVLGDDRDDHTDEAEFGDLAGDDEVLYDAVAATYEPRWDTAAEYDLGVPGRSVLLASFSERWPAASDTLADLFDSAESISWDDVLDPVTACTLVAARHRVLTMNLGEWTEAVGLCSRTEIARAKATLVDIGLVETEREAVGVGRPRHRLVLADDRLTDATAADFGAVARDVLTG